MGRPNAPPVDAQPGGLAFEPMRGTLHISDVLMQVKKIKTLLCLLQASDQLAIWKKNNFTFPSSPVELHQIAHLSIQNKLAKGRWPSSAASLPLSAHLFLLVVPSAKPWIFSNKKEVVTRISILQSLHLSPHPVLAVLPGKQRNCPDVATQCEFLAGGRPSNHWKIK